MKKRKYTVTEVLKAYRVFVNNMLEGEIDSKMFLKKFSDIEVDTLPESVRDIVSEKVSEYVNAIEVIKYDIAKKRK